MLRALWQKEGVAGGVGSESEHSRHEGYALCKMALPFGPANPIVCYNVSDTRSSVIICHCGPRSGFPWCPREEPMLPDRVTTPTMEFWSPV